MTQRTWAALVAVPLFVGLGLYIAFTGLPFLSFSPGPTLNVLGDDDGKPIITITGHPTYPDDGQLRMTTVSVTERNASPDLFSLMKTWLSRDQAVYPFFAEYDSSGSQEQDAREGQLEMASSQDSATAAALRQLHIPIHPHVQIAAVTKGMPADGELQVGDKLVKVGDEPITWKTDIAALLAGVPSGSSVPITVERDGKQVTVDLKPKVVDGHKLVGITLETVYDFPFDVKFDINNIGGPSAGLMFATSIYDLLTPGSLTDGNTVAGTGEISATGQVGEIGGIQQKIAGARKAGAKLFLVPPANCADALGGDNGSMRLVRAPTLRSALSSIKAWAADHDATLPSCEPTKSGATT